jgi:hypothetical protein
MSPTQAPIEWAAGASTSGVNRYEREAGQSGAEVKNVLPLSSSWRGTKLSMEKAQPQPSDGTEWADPVGNCVLIVRLCGQVNIVASL